MIILVGIVLLRTYTPTEKSLIGSFNIKGYLKFIGGEYILLIFTLIFFSTIIFNFVMEWFALAVDSIILILGLIYYLIVYLHKHTEVETNKYLNQVSNTGNQFYLNLIQNFSDKKTFLIGVSIILTLHLIVDIGVYLIPYLFGSSNSLYASSLSTPIFNLINPSNSQIAIDFLNYDNILLDLILLIGHLFTLIFYVLVMIGPFYYFYKFVIKNKSHTTIMIKHIFLVSTITYLSLFLIPELNPPITMNMPELESGIVGVQFETSTIINEKTKTLYLNLIILFTIFILANIEVNHILKKSENYFLKYKLMPIIALLFFIVYMSIFFYSTIDFQSQNIQKSYLNSNAKESSERYNEIILKINDKMISKYATIPLEYKQYNYSLNIELYKEDINSTTYNSYGLLTINNNIQNNQFTIEKLDNAFFKDKNDFKNHKFTNHQTSLIYNFGINNPILIKKEINVEDIKTYLGPPITIKEKSANIIIEILRLTFTIIFYLFGSIAFIRYFLNEKIKE
jgi:hypothetical protein